MRVVCIAAECEPWAKTGGLGDVVDALARAVGADGLVLRVAQPLVEADGMGLCREGDAGEAALPRQLDQRGIAGAAARGASLDTGRVRRPLR